MIMTPRHKSTAVAANALCQDCGVCCMGILHSYADLDDKDEARARAAELPLRQTKKGVFFFVLPCPRLKDNRCSIQAQKPAVCSGYHCIIQRQVMNASVPLEEALSVIASLKKLARKLRAQINVPHQRNSEDLNLYHFLHGYPDKVAKVRVTRALSAAEHAFINDAFEYAKLVDRYFRKSSLLTKYADLVVDLAATQKPLSA